MNAAVGLMDGLGLDGDQCIRVIPRHTQELSTIVLGSRVQVLSEVPFFGEFILV